MASANGAEGRGLRLLSLDGGGIRGLSQLIMLEQLMLNIRAANALDTTPRPAEIFDLIGGTSTGGLNALLVGRLGLSAEDAILEYAKLSKKVFEERKPKGKDGAFKATRMEEAVEQLIEDKGGPRIQPGQDSEHRPKGDPKLTLLDPRTGNSTCKTFVCARNALNMANPRLLRSYNANSVDQYAGTTVVQAARATSAAPTFFKRVMIGPPGLEEPFVDGGLGTNNPVRLVIEESGRLFGSHCPISCIVSLGTGRRNVIGFDKPGYFQRWVPKDVIDVLKEITTDTETVEREMRVKFSSASDVYHRFNVDQGLQDVGMEEWDRLDAVKAHTIAYLNDPDQETRMKTAAEILAGHGAAGSAVMHTLAELAGNVPTMASRVNVIHNIPELQVPHFVGREDLLHRIKAEVTKPSTRTKVIVLVGMGGQGKTQTALKLCGDARHSGHFQAIFWADANTKASLNQGFEDMAAAASWRDPPSDGPRAQIDFVKGKLRDASFLMVLDNYDNPEEIPNLWDYLPSSDKGLVIITSRNHSAAQLGEKVEVDEMSEEDGVTLLRTQSRRGDDPAETQDAFELVKILGCLPLAIDQAAAYIADSNSTFRAYASRFAREKHMLEKLPSVWKYCKRVEDGQGEASKAMGVFASWDLSLRSLGKNDKDRDNIVRFLTFVAFFNGSNVSQFMLAPYFHLLGTFGINIWKCDIKSLEIDIVLSKTSLMERTNCRQGLEWASALMTADGHLDSDRLNDQAAELRKLSLLQPLTHDERGMSLKMHPLVVDWLRLRVDDENHVAFAPAAVLALLAAVIQMSRKKSNPVGLYSELRSHLDVCLAHYRWLLRGLPVKEGQIFTVELRLLSACSYLRRNDELERLGLSLDARKPSGLSSCQIHETLGYSYTATGRFMPAIAFFETARRSRKIAKEAGLKSGQNRDIHEELMLGSLMLAYVRTNDAAKAEELCQTVLGEYETSRSLPKIIDWLETSRAIFDRFNATEPLNTSITIGIHLFEYLLDLRQNDTSELALAVRLCIKFHIGCLQAAKGDVDAALQVLLGMHQGLEATTPRFQELKLVTLRVVIVGHYLEWVRYSRELDSTGQLRSETSCPTTSGLRLDVKHPLVLEFNRRSSSRLREDIFRQQQAPGAQVNLNWIHSLSDQFTPSVEVTDTQLEGTIRQLDACLSSSKLWLASETEAEVLFQIERHKDSPEETQMSILTLKMGLAALYGAQARAEEGLLLIDDVLKAVRSEKPELVRGVVESRVDFLRRLNRTEEMEALQHEYPQIDWDAWRSRTGVLSHQNRDAPHDKVSEENQAATGPEQEISRSFSRSFPFLPVSRRRKMDKSFLALASARRANETDE